MLGRFFWGVSDGVSLLPDHVGGFVHLCYRKHVVHKIDESEGCFFVLFERMTVAMI